MTGRSWLSPRIRRAIVAIYLKTSATPVGWVSPVDLIVIVGKYSTNIVKALLHRELIRELRRDGTGFVFGYELTELGRAHATRVIDEINATVSKSSSHQARAG